MGTRSRIGCRQPDGTIRSIYVHWDGYPTHMAPKLVNLYSDFDTLTRLMDRGDRSTLEDTPEQGMAYEDRGEDCPALVSDNREEFNDIDYGEEYMYLYEPETREWLCNDGYHGDRNRWFVIHENSHN